MGDVPLSVHDRAQQICGRWNCFASSHALYKMLTNISQCASPSYRWDIPDQHWILGQTIMQSIFEIDRVAVIGPSVWSTESCLGWERKLIHSDQERKGMLTSSMELLRVKVRWTVWNWRRWKAKDRRWRREWTEKTRGRIKKSSCANHRVSLEL